MLLNYDKVKNPSNVGLIELGRVMKFSSIFWLILIGLAQLSVASSGLAESGPLKIESVKCEGNTKSSCDFIIEQSALKVGEEIQDDKMHEIKMRMELLGYFDEVEIRLSKGSSVGKVLVTLSVKEHSNISSNITGGMNNISRPGGVADIAVMDRNLTGNGDSLELRARWNNVNVNTDGGNNLGLSSYRFRLEYNRNLGDSKFFLKSGLNYANSNWSYISSNQFQESAGWMDLALGRRLFKYSFVILGARNYFSYSLNSTNGQANSSLSSGFFNRTGPYFQYGWDSQDDPNFPTQGSKFLVSLDALPYASPYSNGILSIGSFSGSVGYRKHWKLAPTHVLSMNLGRVTQNNDITFPLLEQSAFGLRYSKQFKRHASNSSIQNGAFYIEPGVYYTSTSLDSSNYQEFFGVKVGTTLQTSWGVINLFFLGTN